MPSGVLSVGVSLPLTLSNSTPDRFPPGRGVAIPWRRSQSNTGQTLFRTPTNMDIVFIRQSYGLYGLYNNETGEWPVSGQTLQQALETLSSTQFMGVTEMLMGAAMRKSEAASTHRSRMDWRLAAEYFEAACQFLETLDAR